MHFIFWSSWVGEMSLGPGTTAKRKVKGTQRLQRRKDLENKKPSNFLTQLFADEKLDVGAIVKGNITAVQNLAIWKNVRREVSSLFQRTLLVTFVRLSSAPIGTG